MSGYISIKNWKQFQHYKDRSPPWIKLHVSTLDDYEFSCLQDASKWLAVGLWMLASKHDNRIPMDERWIASKLNLTSELDLESLVTAGFIEIHGCEQNASKPLATRKQNATRSVSVSVKDVRKEKEEEADLVFELAWKAYPKRPNNSKADARKAFRARINEGAEPEDLLAGVDRYARYINHTRPEKQFIKQAATFFGPGQHWQNDFEIDDGPDHTDKVGPIVELLNASSSWIQLPETRPDAFDELSRKRPELWARAGPEFQKLRFAPCFDLKSKGDHFGLRKEIECQLSAMSTNGSG